MEVDCDPHEKLAQSVGAEAIHASLFKPAEAGAGAGVSERQYSRRVTVAMPRAPASVWDRLEPTSTADITRGVSVGGVASSVSSFVDEMALRPGRRPASAARRAAAIAEMRDAVAGQSAALAQELTAAGVTFPREGRLTPSARQQPTAAHRPHGDSDSLWRGGGSQPPASPGRRFKGQHAGARDLSLDARSLPRLEAASRRDPTASAAAGAPWLRRWRRPAASHDFAAEGARPFAAGAVFAQACQLAGVRPAARVARSLEAPAPLTLDGGIEDALIAPLCCALADGAVETDQVRITGESRAISDRSAAALLDALAVQPALRVLVVNAAALCAAGSWQAGPLTPS